MDVQEIADIGSGVESAGIPVPDLRDLFPNAFMREYTKFGTFGDLLRALGKGPEGAAEDSWFCSPAANELIVQNSEFISWPDMLHTAEDYYIMRQTQPLHTV